MDENLDFKAYTWNDCTYWYDSKKQLFELYSSLESHYTFCIYWEDSRWAAEILEYGECFPLETLSRIGVFETFDLCHLLALVGILHLEGISNIVLEKTWTAEIQKVLTTINTWCKVPPIWIDKFSPFPPESTEEFDF